MANLNKVMLIGRLTRDPEETTTRSGAKVAKFGLAVNNRRFNKQAEKWDDDPVFIDCEAWNRGESGTTADLVMQHLRKGSQVFVEGKLKLDQWTSQDGQNRSAIRVSVDGVQFLDPKSPEGASGPSQRADTQRSSRQDRHSGFGGHQDRKPAHQPAPEEEIPF